MRIVKYSFTLLLLIIAISVWAQPDSVMNKEVQVVKAYQPSISDAFKINSSPEIKDTSVFTPTFNYQIISNPVEIKRSIMPLGSAKLSKSPAEKYGMGFIQGGFGNYITPYGELYFNTKPSKKMDFGLHFYHLSSSPKIKLDNKIEVTAPFSDNQASLFMKNYFRKATLNSSFYYTRNRYDFYGFPGSDTLMYKQSDSELTTLNKTQIENNAGAVFTYDKAESSDELDYTIDLGYNYLWNKSGQKAHDGYVLGKFIYDLRKSNVNVDLKLSYFSQDSIVNAYILANKHQYFLAEFSPAFNYSKKLIDIKIGINLSLLADDDTTSLFHFSPKSFFAFHPLPEFLTIYLGTDGKIQPNNYRQITRTNRYAMVQADAKPTQNIIEIFGGIKGKITQKVSYDISVDYLKQENAILFYNRQLSSTVSGLNLYSNSFELLYDDINTLQFGGNVRYSANKNLEVTLKGNYYQYELKNEAEAWNLPLYNVQFDTRVKITDQISAYVNMSYISERFAKVDSISEVLNVENALPEIVRNSSEVKYKLNPIVDISIGGTYQYNAKLNFFLNANNLINQHSEPWLGYKSQGIMIMAGARYMF